MNNVVLNETLVLNKDITLDLAGHTISGELGTLIKITDGSVIIKNGVIQNAHATAAETKYSIHMSGDAVSLYDNARIDAITGGKYESYYSDKYLDTWRETHSYSGIVSYPINLNRDGASIGTISGGTFLGVMDKAYNGTPLHVNNGKVELISGGYFGFSEIGLTTPEKMLFINSGTNASIGKITGGTFEKGSWGTGYGCDFENIVAASGCQVKDTGTTVERDVQYSTKVTTYTLNVVEVTAK